MRVFAVRGATSIEFDQADEIVEKTTDLVNRIIIANKLQVRRIVSIQFTVTPDLQSLNPAAALRRGRKDLPGVPLFVAQEPITLDSMEKVVRVLLYFRAPFWYKSKAQYLGRARNLRPDLS